MKIHEYQARELFSAAGLPVPDARVARTPAEARAIAAELDVPVVVKAQVLTGGRGKAGGVKLAADPDEAEAAAEKILGLDVRGYIVEKVIVAMASDIATEIYLGAIVDRQSRSVLLMASAEGGLCAGRVSVLVDDGAQTRQQRRTGVVPEDERAEPTQQLGA
ncbi:MAG: acetate--CoA ligase family protein, partial [Chloroflexota bacterium]|nr:acetate--CoA ligase family protein [Chloroflexota bacterium]